MTGSSGTPPPPCCSASRRRPGRPLHLLHTQTAGRRRPAPPREGGGPGRLRRAQPVGRSSSATTGRTSSGWAPTRCRYYVPETNTEPLWAALRDGTIDLISTDHAPHTREEKEPGWTDGWKAHTGTPSTQFYVPLFLDAACRGRISPGAGRRAHRDRAGPPLRARAEGPARGRLRRRHRHRRPRRRAGDPRRDRPQQDRLHAVRRQARPRRHRHDAGPRPRRLRATAPSSGEPGWGRQARPAPHLHRREPSTQPKELVHRWPRASVCSCRTSARRPTRTS